MKNKKNIYIYKIENQLREGEKFHHINILCRPRGSIVERLTQARRPLLVNSYIPFTSIFIYKSPGASAFTRWCGVQLHIHIFFLCRPLFSTLSISFPLLSHTTRVDTRDCISMYFYARVIAPTAYFYREDAPICNFTRQRQRRRSDEGSFFGIFFLNIEISKIKIKIFFLI